MKNNKIFFSLTIFTFLFLSQTIFAQELEYELLYEIEATLDTSINVGETLMGTRVVFPVTGGSFKGTKLQGQILSGGGDWLLKLDATTSKLDVRILLETDDGALIYNTYTGFIHTKPDGSLYFRIIPIFETSSEKYKWLNHTIAVGIGRRIEGGVAYKVYAIK